MSRPNYVPLLFALMHVVLTLSQVHVVLTSTEVSMSLAEDSLNDVTDVTHDHHPKSGCFSVEKAMKCDGSFEKEKGGGKACEGGVKAEFYANTTAQDIADIVAPELHDQINSLLPSQDRDGLIEDINNDVFDAMLAFDDNSLMANCLGIDCEKKVEFGGFMSVGWGCNVTFGMKDGEFSKEVKCGVKGKKGLGKKPTGAMQYGKVV